LEWVQLEWVLINRYVGPGLGLFFRVPGLEIAHRPVETFAISPGRTRPDNSI